MLLRPAPVSGLRGTRSPFLPEFDPFWARVQESGVLVALHASDSGYQDYLNTWEGSTGEYVAFRPQTFANVADGGRSIHDALASAICHGMLTRFPDVRLMSVENGGSWVGPLLRHLDLAYKKMPNEFPEHPREGLDDPLGFRRQIDHLPVTDVERIMSTNMFDLLELAAPAA